MFIAEFERKDLYSYYGVFCSSHCTMHFVSSLFIYVLSENNGVSLLCLWTELSIMSADKGAILNMKYNLPDRILREIVYFAKEHSITKIILFGSRARGTNTERSDIDIAVYGGDFDGFYWDIKEKTHSLLMFDIVQADVSISDELKEEIEKDGVVIYEKA